MRSRTPLPPKRARAGRAWARLVVALCALVLVVWPCDHSLSERNSVRLAADAVKEPLRGLISMGAYKFAPALGEPDNSLDTVRQKSGLLQGIVILASWRSLEPTATSGLADNNEIDQGLANVRKYNQDNPKTPLAVKIRVWGGFWAPDWVMEDSGGKVPVVHTNFRGVAKDRTLGHVWDDRYHLRWAHLQELLAAKYDGDPLVHEVAVTSCMMFTAEPFSIDTRPAAVDPLRKAGMTDANYKACLNRIVDDYAPWKTTRFETPLNPFKATDSGKPVHDVDFTLAWMADCRKRAGDRCVFDNHDLDVPKKVNKDLQTIYAAMKSSGAEVEFQTGGASPPDLGAVIGYGVQQGATSIELYQDYGGFTEVPDDDLRKYAAMLEHN
ncbi:hypothetical protein [Mycobacterium sp. Aquia_213]|uniref:hypothetical protein n=1 Tax=Mycobacterium sp. Aquia_213 TaxID=2991728 RepID=UPI00226FD837|nr:hypothetical protein [Mycobacterium sp. Aquia_213]WAC92301.1 hypothetical protein LMQ14_03595 [Mycobacterium sp. Aquia_213]